MKNSNSWKPSKYVLTKHGLRASRDKTEVAPGSWFVADILAGVYERALKTHARGVLLDLGCGKVPLYQVYKDYVSDNICVDWKNTFHKNAYLDFECDLNTGVPLPDQQFDTILVTDLMEHILNPDIVWKDIARLLKPRGRIIMGVPFFYWIHEEPYDYFRYTEYKLRSFCDNNGLIVLELTRYGGLLEVILNIIAKLVKFSVIISKLHLSISKILVKSYIGRWMFKKTSAKYPLGYCLVAQKK